MLPAVVRACQQTAREQHPERKERVVVVLRARGRCHGSEATPVDGGANGGLVSEWRLVQHAQARLSRPLPDHCQDLQQPPHQACSRSEKIRAAEIGSPAIIGNVNEVIEVVATLKEIGVKELIIPDFTLGTLIGADTVKQDLMEKFITEVAAVAK